MGNANRAMEEYPMSWMPGADPSLDAETCPDEVSMVIVPRNSDVGGLEVRRALPFRTKRLVGPFIFWDQMGPGEFITGQGMDVLPHPHIGLSTVTYLLEGSTVHRDSLGTNQTIAPGAINLMSAGAGVAHSERTGEAERAAPSRMLGIQSWVAQPQALEHSEPSFQHYAKEAIPTVESDGVSITVLMGSFQGVTSPVRCDWETVYADITLPAGGRLHIPAEVEERALYTVSGEIEIGGVAYESQRMLVLCPKRGVTIHATTDTRVLLLGGAVMDGPRHIWWNFVASSKERIEEAKARWKAGEFHTVPGDEDAIVPLPE